MEHANQAILETAIAAARAAGAIQKEKYGTLLNVDQKLRHDIKLEADRLCENAIIGVIRTTFPGHAVVAEESGAVEGSEYVWYVDPLDGTVNFYYGMPYFCTTLACYRHDGKAMEHRKGATLAVAGEPVAAATYAVLTGDMFTALAGSGAWLNEQPIRVRDDGDLSDAYIITAIGDVRRNGRFLADRTIPLAARVRKMRVMGACAYDLGNVAAGRASGFYEYGVNVWDWAAGRVIVEAAGGRFSGWQIAPGKWAVAASGAAIHQALVDTLHFEEE